MYVVSKNYYGFCFIQRVYDEEIEEPPAKPDVPERQSEQVGYGLSKIF